ncbi:hypothetical protein LAZ67_4001320 [Cordylochernes scorpioides]|uniref:Uncharacterized protein n=1 Tax=Cordylochernes scorpioides TaxID=51811 RepID=A0ABY6KF81_9ARAC|nr:hypothetical protein LAZ67_4001320 [Cordylochernes scorpioides]
MNKDEKEAREQEIGEFPNNDHGPTTPPPLLCIIILQLATILEGLQPLHPQDLDLTSFDAFPLPSPAITSSAQRQQSPEVFNSSRNHPFQEESKLIFRIHQRFRLWEIYLNNETINIYSDARCWKNVQSNNNSSVFNKREGPENLLYLLIGRNKYIPSLKYILIFLQTISNQVFNDFLVDIKSKAQECDFGELFNFMFCDRIVVGIGDNNI